MDEDIKTEITCNLCGKDITKEYENHKCNIIKRSIFGRQKTDLSVWLSVCVAIILQELDVFWLIIVYMFLLEYLIDPMIRRLLKRIKTNLKMDKEIKTVTTVELTKKDLLLMLNQLEKTKKDKITLRD